MPKSCVAKSTAKTINMNINMILKALMENCSSRKKQIMKLLIFSSSCFQRCCRVDISISDPNGCNHYKDKDVKF
jgi:hypothetical protein